jgi:hypothetical protein
MSINDLPIEMSINDLPIEMITKILDYIQMTDGGYIGKLSQCYSCEDSKQKCIHIGLYEGRSLKKIISICKLWYIIIQDHNFLIYKPSIIHRHNQLAHTLTF